MNAEILAVGTELLMGQISNTNAQYISRRLPEAGIGVYHHSVVGDNPERLKTALREALERSDIVLTTGGLGPTQDDLTKETIAEFFGLPLVVDQESLDIMCSIFSRLGREMTENNIKQAYLPEGSRIIRNKNGTAPGCIIEHCGKIVVLLPGPPSEMRPMFDDSVLPFLKAHTGNHLESCFLRIFGIGESQMETRILDLVTAQSNPTIAPYAKDGEVLLRITANVSEGQSADVILQPLISEIKSRLGNAVYAMEDKELHEITAALLLKSGKSISTAESCTGGMLASALTSVPGISSVFGRGFVTYSNSSKTEQLGVREETLSAVGAVSLETATEMAEGVRRVSASDIGIAVTGIAGPDGGTPEKPVGTVFVALAAPEGTYVKHLKLWGDRERIRKVTTLHALDMIRRYLLGLAVIENEH